MKLKRMSEESIKNASTPENNFAPKWIVAYPLPKANFNWNCLKEDSVSFLHESVVNLCIIYELDAWSTDSTTDFTVGSCLLRILKLTKNADFDKYRYTGYGIGFDALTQFSWSDGSWG